MYTITIVVILSLIDRAYTYTIGTAILIKVCVHKCNVFTSSIFSVQNLLHSIIILL